LWDLAVTLESDPSVPHGKSLEEYLRSLWGQIIQRRDEKPTYGLFIELFRSAFRAPPIPLDPSWLDQSKNPPDLLLRVFSDNHLRELARGGVPLAPVKPEDAQSDFDLLEATILFQIADLRKMAERRPMEEWGEGVPSPTGHHWANLTPLMYLDGAIRGFVSHLGAGHFRDTTETRCDWASLAFILTLGQMYE